MIHTDGKPTIANRVISGREMRDNKRTGLEERRVLSAAERITHEAAEEYDKSKADPYDEAWGLDREDTDQ